MQPTPPVQPAAGAPAQFSFAEVSLQARRIIRRIDDGLAAGNTFDEVFDEAADDIALTALRLVAAGFEALFSASISLEALADRR